MRILITGICGFIGSHIFEHLIRNTDFEIIGLDKLTYASSGYDRLRDTGFFEDKRLKLFSADFSYAIPCGLIKEIDHIDYILHLGAESHVDRSIENPEPFVISNVLGTMHILNLAKLSKDLKCFFYFSTDEVMGPAPEGIFYKEEDAHNPSNPYSATKSAGEMLVKAYQNTYKLPAIITRTMNCGGQRQHPEKFIPMCIRKIYLGETVIIHADKTKSKSGSRFYIHARNVADAYLFLINKIESGVNIIGETYHIIGEQEIENLKLAEMIAKYMGKDLKYEMVDFHSSRPGHDLRYALSGEKIKKLGWNSPISFEDSLKHTIDWSLKLENKHWVGL